MTVISPVLVPAVVAGMIWMLGWRLWRRHDLPSRANWSGAPAMGLAYLLGAVLLLGWPAWTPVASRDWLFYLVIGAIVACALEQFWREPYWVAGPIRVAIVLAFAWFQTGSMREHYWEPLEAAAYLVGMTALSVLVWFSIDRVAEKRPGFFVPFHSWLVVSAAAGIMVLGASASHGQLAGTLAAALGAAVLLSLWAPKLSIAAGAAGVFTLIYSSLVWQSHFYSEVPIVAAVALLLAPCALWTARIPFKTRPALKSALASFLIVLAPLAVAWWFAYDVYVDNQAETEDYYEY